MAEFGDRLDLLCNSIAIITLLIQIIQQCKSRITQFRGTLYQCVHRSAPAFKKATPLQKQIVGAWVLGIVPMIVGGIMGDATPLWAIIWMTSVLLALAVGIGHAYIRATRQPSSPVA